MLGHQKEGRKKVLCASQCLAANSLESIPGVLKIVILIGFFKKISNNLLNVKRFNNLYGIFSFLNLSAFLLLLTVSVLGF